MPRVNWNDIPDESGFDLIPEGNYLLRIVGCVSKTTAKGELWDLILEVLEGDHKGSKVGDALLWFGKAAVRTKLCLRHMGFECEGSEDWHPSNLIGLPVDCNIVHKEREWDGKKIKEAKPSYDGYRRRMDAEWKPQSAPNRVEVDPMSSEEVPF